MQPIADVFRRLRYPLAACAVASASASLLQHAYFSPQLVRPVPFHFSATGSPSMFRPRSDYWWYVALTCAMGTGAVACQAAAQRATAASTRYNPLVVSAGSLAAGAWVVVGTQYWAAQVGREAAEDEQMPIWGPPLLLAVALAPWTRRQFATRVNPPLR